MRYVYIIKKYIPADSLSQAIKKEKDYPVTDAWMDDRSTTVYTDKIMNRKDIGFKK